MIIINALERSIVHDGAGNSSPSEGRNLGSINNIEGFTAI